jgi:hypothetical protein
MAYQFNVREYRSRKYAVRMVPLHRVEDGIRYEDAYVRF